MILNSMHQFTRGLISLAKWQHSIYKSTKLQIIILKNVLKILQQFPHANSIMWKLLSVGPTDFAYFFNLLYYHDCSHHQEQSLTFAKCFLYVRPCPKVFSLRQTSHLKLTKSREVARVVFFVLLNRELRHRKVKSFALSQSHMNLILKYIQILQMLYAFAHLCSFANYWFCPELFNFFLSDHLLLILQDLV